MRHNKLRTALTGLSVAWGIFMLITLVSAANAIIRSFEENMMNSDNQKISVWGGVTTKPYRGYREGRSINLKNDDINTLSREQRDVVEEVTSELNGRQSGVATNTTYVEAGFTGVFPSARDLNRLDMVDGRFISQADLDNKTKVMVLPKEYAEQLSRPTGKRPSASGSTASDSRFWSWGYTNPGFAPYTYLTPRPRYSRQTTPTLTR